MNSYFKENAKAFAKKFGIGLFYLIYHNLFGLQSDSSTILVKP